MTALYISNNALLFSALNITYILDSAVGRPNLSILPRAIHIPESRYLPKVHGSGTGTWKPI